MANDLLEQLKRNLLMYEQAGMEDEAEKVRARLAEFDKPEPKEEESTSESTSEPEPIKHGPGRPRKTKEE